MNGVAQGMLEWYKLVSPNGGAFSAKKENKVVFPIVKFEHLKKILLTLLDNNGKGMSREELSRKTNLGKSLLSNSIPILKELELINSFGSVKGDLLHLTPNGELLAICLKKDDKVILKDLTQNVLNKSKVLRKAYLLLISNINLTPYELGVKLAEEFGKKWDTRSTYGAVGRSCIEILRGFGLIDYKIKRGKQHRFKVRDYRLIPTASANKIFSILSRIDNIVEIPSEIIKTQKEQEQFKTLVDLKLVENIGNRTFRLSELGRKLKREIENGNGSEVFRDAILRHKPSVDAIAKLKEKGVFNWKVVGEVIEEINEEQYKEVTRNDYGKKFLSWLKRANIVEEVSRGKYRIRKSCFCEHVFYIGDNLEPKLLEEDNEMTVEGGNTKLAEKQEQITTELINSDFDIAIADGRIFIKWEKKIGDEVIVGIEDVTSKLNGKRLGYGEIMFKDGVTFIKSANQG